MARTTKLMAGVFVLLGGLLASGQDTGSLRGRVVDMTSVIAPGAYVELTRGSQHLEVRADEKGEFRFQDLPAGEYDLTAKQFGFKWFHLLRIVVAVGESRTLPDIPLNVASMCGYPYPEYSLTADVTKGEIEIRFWRTPYATTVRTPADKVEVKIEGPDASMIRGRTDGKGYFRATDLKPGFYRSLDLENKYSAYVFAGWKQAFALDAVGNVSGGRLRL